jgi:hypothetical protein
MRESIKKYQNFMKSKLRVNEQKTMALIMAAFYRSLLIYFCVPLYAAGAISEQQVENMEVEFKR